ncbi:MAG: hypothetical protein KGD63_13580 [Candidatus Lokiarchaeota archaeon]|nr:hypothetical protein [Candidatus Lokiarchaeota archaeon]
MTEMKIPIIITKKDCGRCIELKEWMKNNDKKYIEKDLDDEEFVHQLLHDGNFIKTFCDEEGCVVNTPVVIHHGKYFFKELWGISGLKENKVSELFSNQ